MHDSGLGLDTLASNLLPQRGVGRRITKNTRLLPILERENSVVSVRSGSEGPKHFDSSLVERPVVEVPFFPKQTLDLSTRAVVRGTSPQQVGNPHDSAPSIDGAHIKEPGYAILFGELGDRA